MYHTTSNPTAISVSPTIIVFLALVTKIGYSLTDSSSSVNLQLPHIERGPADTLKYLAHQCECLGVHKFDVYGDFPTDDASVENTSFLRTLEQEIAAEFGKEDAIFMPSGGMAQSIALLIHARPGNKACGSRSKDGEPTTAHFACHHTSHLLLHEQDAYRDLLQMEPIIISTIDEADGIHVPPMTFADIRRVIGMHPCKPETLILELPHREIGGKLTPWNDVMRIREYCTEQDIKFHLDGARIFEATSGYNDISLREIASAFDSVYISFYKGLGGLAGAMLLGDKDFIDQARIWLRRFGGNLYTLMPYAVSGWTGFRRQWRLESQDDSESLLSFQNKKDKLVHIVKELSKDPEISNIVTFDPAMPETNMVHGYLRYSVEECNAALDQVESKLGIRVLVRVRPVEVTTDPAYKYGYRSRFEWAIGESNGKIPNKTFLLGWRAFAKIILQSQL